MKRVLFLVLKSFFVCILCLSAFDGSLCFFIYTSRSATELILFCVQAHEFIIWAFCYCEKQIDLSVSCVGVVFHNELPYKIVKLVRRRNS